MAAKQLIVTNSGSQLVDMTPSEEAALAAGQVEASARMTALANRQAAARALEPGSGLRAKLKDGTALAAPEIAQVLRWICLKLDPTIAD